MVAPSTAASLAPDELREFREVAEEFLADAASSARVRAVVASGGSPDRALVARPADMGWWGLEVPEDLGGAGVGFAELAVVLEASGAHLSSLPLVSSAVLAVGAITLAGSEQQRADRLPGLAAGAVLGTAALPGAFGAADAVVATPVGPDLHLSGRVAHVPDGRCADVLVVAAVDARGARVVGVLDRATAGVRVQPVAMTDATRAFDTLDVTGAVLADRDVLARGPEADRLLAALVNRASVAVAVEAVGLAGRVLDLTVAYTSQRTQFGRPVGSFQAVKHQAADMFVDTETSRELVRDAVRAVAEDPAGEEATVAASRAKAHACEKAARCAGVAVQLHGGIGYTWEHDLHLFLKRAVLDEHLVGTARWHRERVAVRTLDRGSARP